MKKQIIIAYAVLFLSIGVMLYAGWRLVEAELMYRAGNTAYDDLSGKVRSKQTEADGLGIPELKIDFKALQKINKDAVAWLYCPETVLDYPVMQAEDYSYYLKHLPDGAVNANGSLFIDYNSAADFSGKLTVIYGHNMKSGRMFGGLTEYKEQSYYVKHPYIYLYTAQNRYRLELIYGFVVGDGQWRDRAFMYGINLDELLTYAAYNSTFESDAEYKYKEGDKIVALSTCSYEFDEARYVVLGVLREK